MNAPFRKIKAAPAMSSDSVSAFLNRLSVEITARQIDKVALLAERLAPGTRVFVALIDAADVAGQLAAARALRRAGLEPVPHVPARFIRDLDDLKDRIASLAQEAEVAEMLVIGGGAAQPVGIYDAAMGILSTGVFEANGIRRIGLAGHPEGNADITRIHGDAMLMTALKEKQAWLRSAGIEGFIATQFLFEAKPVADWARGLRAAGIDLPIHAGVPGPATIKTLVKFAAMCGVGNSARFVRKQALNITRLLSVSAPDDFVAGLAALHAGEPGLRIAGPHFYPFGGIDKLLDWLGPKLA